MAIEVSAKALLARPQAGQLWHTACVRQHSRQGSRNGSDRLAVYCAAQGIIGETYNRMLMGPDALSNPASPAYLPDDMQFYGQGAEATYAVAAYFSEGATSVSGKVRARKLHTYPLGASVEL